MFSPVATIFRTASARAQMSLAETTLIACKPLENLGTWVGNNIPRCAVPVLDRGAIGAAS